MSSQHLVEVLFYFCIFAAPFLDIHSILHQIYVRSTVNHMQKAISKSNNVVEHTVIGLQARLYQKSIDVKQGVIKGAGALPILGTTR